MIDKTDMDLRMDALKELMPNGYGYSGDETDYVITKPDDSDDKIPTLAEMEAKVVELRKDYDAKKYARNRQMEYPDWGTQLNKIYDDGVDKWKSEMVDPVKAKWPKDNSGPK